MSEHKDWIKCIAGETKSGKSKEDVEDLCNEPFYDDILVRGDDDLYGDDTIFQLDF